MLSYIKRIGVYILKFFTGLLMRLLTLLSLLIPVVCCVVFLYGLYAHSNFYSLFSILGAVAFVYVNKQT